MYIESLSNKKIKDLNKLKNKKYRDLENLFLVEGWHLVKEAYNAGILKEVLVLKDTFVEMNCNIIYTTEEVLKYLSDVDTPQNIIGVCKKIDNNKIGKKVVILDDIQDPGNLGTIIRSSVAFNFDTIILSNNSVDIYNPKVIRATQGMLFKVNIIRCDLTEEISKLKDDGYRILATKVTNGKDVKTLEKIEKLCIIMGNEGNGVSDKVLALADDFIYIKMNKNCESLNVGVATSILLYELGSD
ncbi:MAG: RNA methyltransferase [Bacilli bacterium]|nr:RNA methyltransferase [Bacilli bacterium]